MKRKTKNEYYHCSTTKNLLYSSSESGQGLDGQKAVLSVVEFLKGSWPGRFHWILLLGYQ
jgi:hypothetical protein